MFRTLLIAALTLGTLTACGDDEPAPEHAPDIIRGDVVCRSLDEDNFTLDRVELTVVDLDGFGETPEHVIYAAVEATPIEMELIAQPWNPEEGKCKNEDCKMLYRWERTPQSEQFHCGADGKLLEVDFKVIDPSGLSHQAFIPSRPR